MVWPATGCAISLVFGWCHGILCLLALSCEAPAAQKTRELQTCTFQSPGVSNTTKIPREDPPKGRRMNEICGGRGKKKTRNFWVPRPSGPFFQIRGRTPSPLLSPLPYVSSISLPLPPINILKIMVKIELQLQLQLQLQL